MRRPLALLAAAAAIAAAVLTVGGCEALSLDYLQDEPADAGRASADATTSTDGGTSADAGADASTMDAAPPPDAALPYVVYYHFDNGTTDSSGNGFDGVLLGDASVDVPGVRGSALSCKGGQDTMTFPEAAFFPHATSFTIAFFFQLTPGADGGTAAPQNTFFWKGSSWDNSLDTTAGVAIGYWSFLPYYLIGAVNDGADGRNGFTNAGYLPPTGIPLADGKFHHAAIVVDRANDELLLYADGAKRQNTVLTAMADGGPFGSIDAPFVGQLCSENGGYQYALDGALDEFMIVSRALTASEIASLASVADGGAAP